MQLRDYLNLHGMSQQNFADWVGVHQSLVSMWISGKRKPTAAQIKEIHRRTRGDVTFEDFYGLQRRRRRRTSEHKSDVPADYDYFSIPHHGIRRSGSAQ